MTPPPPPDRRAPGRPGTKPAHLAPVVIATGLGFALTLLESGSRDLTGDEAATFFWAHFPPAELWDTAARDHQAPFYYLFMHFWLKLGTSEFWMRLPSMLFFAATVPVAWAIARTVADATAGTYAAFLVATAPWGLQMAQNARTYAALTFFCALALLGVALLLARFRREADTPERLSSIGAGLSGALRAAGRGEWSLAGNALRCDGPWLLWIVATVIAMNLHHTAILLPALTGLILLAGCPGGLRRRMFLHLTIASAVIALLYAPGLPGLLVAAEKVGRGFWIAPASPHDLFRIFVDTYVRYHLFGPWLVAPGLLLAGVVALGLFSLLKQKQWHWLIFLLLAWLGWTALLLVVGWIYQPVLLSRTLTWTIVPFLVLVAVGLRALSLLPRSRRGGAAGLLGLGLLLAFQAHGIWREARDPEQIWKYQEWRRLVQFVGGESSGARALVGCQMRIPNGFNYYWRRQEDAGEIDRFEGMGGTKVSPHAAPLMGDPAKWRKLAPDSMEASMLFPEYERVTMIARFPVKTPTGPTSPPARPASTNAPARGACNPVAIEEALAGQGRLVHRERFRHRLGHGSATVSVWERKPDVSRGK